MDTKTMDRTRRKAVKRAIRKHRRAERRVELTWGPARRSVERTKMAFARSWTGGRAIALLDSYNRFYE